MVNSFWSKDAVGVLSRMYYSDKMSIFSLFYAKFSRILETRLA